MFPKIIGTPKSSILIRFSIINHPFCGSPILGNTPVPFPPRHLRVFFFVFPARHETVGFRGVCVAHLCGNPDGRQIPKRMRARRQPTPHNHRAKFHHLVHRAQLRTPSNLASPKKNKRSSDGSASVGSVDGQACRLKIAGF